MKKTAFSIYACVPHIFKHTFGFGSMVDVSSLVLTAFVLNSVSKKPLLILAISTCICYLAVKHLGQLQPCYNLLPTISATYIFSGNLVMACSNVFASPILVTGGVCVVVLLLVIYKWYRRPTKFPPGPRGFPVFGCVPFVLGKSASAVYRKWSQIYGPIFSVRMGSKDWVVLNDYDSVSEVLLCCSFDLFGE